jgi:hypothetical protein
MEGHFNKTDEAKIVSTMVLLLFGTKSQRLNMLIKRRHDVQHNDIFHNNKQM